MSNTVYLDRESLKCLQRIAEALERAFPKPKSDGKMVTGVASYNYDSEQTIELRRIAGQAATPGGSEEPGQ